MLYRPSTNKVIWFKQGPWRFQHDVDIINKNTIAIFDNNPSLGWDGLLLTIIYTFITLKLDLVKKNMKNYLSVVILIAELDHSIEFLKMIYI